MTFPMSIGILLSLGGYDDDDDDDDELYYSLNVLSLGTRALLIGETLLRMITTKVKT